ncbi:MAG: PD-(D/E)XK nuclease family protein [Acidimicrobiia bacterium]|nr:PD-(D/E)XK nuclease family protein [Acidimicrobiia bacterium]
MIESVQGVSYGAAATAALAATIADLQAGDRLRPVTVIVPSNAAGLAARRVVAAAGGLANVGFLTPYALAERLGRARAAVAGQEQLTEPLLIAAIRRELRADAGIFDPVAAHAGTERALARRYAELSRARPETLDRIARAGSSRARALVAFCRRVQIRLAHYADEDALADHAIAAVGAGDPTVTALGAVVVHLPQPLAPRLRSLVAELVRTCPSVAVVGLTGDDDADAGVREACRLLDIHLDDPETATVATGTVATGTEIITASDPDEEVRAVVRRLLAIAETGVPFDRMAILYPPVEPYARTVDAQLRAAGIAHNGPAVRTLADSMAGRMLERLLQLVGAEFARDELVAFFASTPMRGVDGGAIPIERWDRISRRAGVVDGDGWEVGLDAYARDLDQQADDRVAAGLGGEVRNRREAQATRALRDFVADLRDRLSAMERAAGWAARAGETRTVLLDLLGDADARSTWPEPEQDALTAALLVLDRCAVLDAVEPDPSFAVFASAVSTELRSPVGRIGRYGEGVLCAGLATGIGLDLDAVFVVGLSEGVVPASGREDALLADADRALAVESELRTRDRMRAQQRRDYLAALSAASTHRVLTHARGDLRSARERLPSRYLLETASARLGERVFASTFDTVDPAAGVEVVPSFAAGLARIELATTVADRDLGVLAAAAERDGDVIDHPLVQSSGAAAGIDAIRGRASGALTRWDGNVSGVADQVPSPATGEIVSATRLQNWCECPFKYFLTHVVRIPVEEEPERLLELSALARGTLVHEVLEQFIAEELAKPPAEQVPAGEPWPRAAQDRILAIVEELAAAAEAKGITGKAVLWDLHQDEIVVDVLTFLAEDSAHRVGEGVVPESVEFPFGFDTAPPVDVVVPSGEVVRFRGRADRIDRRPDGTRVVLDYKTGGQPPTPDGCENDPVWAGRRLQLPVYAEAVRQQLGADSVESAYWYVSQKGGFQRDSVVLDDETASRFREVVGQIVAGIDGGIFPAAPGEPNWFNAAGANCTYCDFDALCPADRGAQYDAKEAAPEFQVFHDLMPEVEE